MQFLQFNTRKPERLLGRNKAGVGGANVNRPDLDR
jgi:hypothetical protein